MANFILFKQRRDRECVKLVFQGYIYNREFGKGGKNGRYYWACPQYTTTKCHGHAITDMEFNATMTKQHNHEPLPPEEEENLVKKHFITQEEVKIRFEHHQTTKRREPKTISNADIDHIIQRLIFDSDEDGEKEKSKPTKVIDKEERLEQRETTKHLLSANTIDFSIAKLMSNFILCQTKREECVKLVFQGYIYTKEFANGTKGQSYWKCTKYRTCPGRAVTDIDFNAAMTKQHNHEPLPPEEEEMLVKKQFIAKEEAKNWFVKHREQRNSEVSISNVDIDHIMQRLEIDSDEDGEEENSTGNEEVEEAGPEENQKSCKKFSTLYSRFYVASTSYRYPIARTYTPPLYRLHLFRLRPYIANKCINKMLVENMAHRLEVHKLAVAARRWKKIHAFMGNKLNHAHSLYSYECIDCWFKLEGLPFVPIVYLIIDHFLDCKDHQVISDVKEMFMQERESFNAFLGPDFNHVYKLPKEAVLTIFPYNKMDIHHCALQMPGNRVSNSKDFRCSQQVLQIGNQEDGEEKDGIEELEGSSNSMDIVDGNGNSMDILDGSGMDIVDVNVDSIAGINDDMLMFLESHFS